MRDPQNGLSPHKFSRDVTLEHNQIVNQFP